MIPIVIPFFDEATFTASFIVRDPGSAAAAIIDPVLDFDPRNGRTSTRSADAMIARVRQDGLRVEWVLDTHVHADHLSALSYIKGEVGGRTGIGAGVTRVQQTFKPIFGLGSGFATDGRQFDHLFADEEAFTIGTLSARALATPGHTPADMTYLVGEAAFVGDTLFMPDYGTARADFPGGNAAILYRSIRRILDLPAQTRVFVGHDYKAPGRDHFAWETSVAAQRASNVHVHDGVDEAAFVTMRQKRDSGLSAPNLLIPSIQVNMRAGALPPAGSDGRTYLTYPINVL